MNKYKYSFDLGAFFGSEEKETKFKAAPEVETSILPRPKQKQEAVQESEPAYDPYGFIPDFAAAYEGAGGVPSVGSDLPLPAGEEQSRYALAVESLLNEIQGSLTPQPDLTAATPALNLEPPVVEGRKEKAKPVEAEIIQAAVEGVLSEVADTAEGTPVTTEDETTGGLMSPTTDIDKLPLSMGTVVEEGKPAVKEAQSRLKGLGFYQNKVDGSAGRATSNAIKTFQYYNDLEPTGVADDATRTKLSLTNVDKRKLAKESSNPLLAYLAKGEGGGYGAANDYNSNKGKAAWGVRDSYFSDSKGKPLEQLTIKEVQEIQAGGYGNRDVFAVGAYQIVPKTMNEVVSKMGLTGDEVFSPELQDRIALEYLIPKKRPTLGKYLNAEEGVSVDSAMMDLAREWASVPVPKDTKDTKGRPVKKGQSFYVHYGNQKAAHSVAETEELLKEARLNKMMSRGS